MPVNAPRRQRRPWELAGPVVLEESVIAIRPDHRRIVMLDRLTGNELETHDAMTRDRWNSPTYLLANDHYVYAVGSQVRAFRHDSLDRPTWMFPPAPVSHEDGSISQQEQIGILGRIQIVDGSLVVPTDRGLTVLDDKTGLASHTLSLEITGNPVAIDSQLIMASADALEAYMSLGRAEHMLREQIAAAPGDPAPSLALLQLGMRVGDLSMALHAAELALPAIEAMAPDRLAVDARRELFAMLLEMHRNGIATTIEHNHALYAMLGSVARSAEQRVEHLLAYGDQLTGVSGQQAANVYQVILSDPILAKTLRSEAGVFRPASMWAAQRLGSLIDRRGLEVYAKQTAIATERYKELVGSKTDASDALASLATEFPFAPAGIDAAISAATMRLQASNEQRALAVLSDALHLAPRPARAKRLLGPFVEIQLERDYVDHAREVVANIIGAYGDITLDTTAGAHSAVRWLEELDLASQAGGKPRIGANAGSGEVVRGRLLPTARAMTGDRPADLALLRDGGDVRLLSPRSTKPRWTAVLDYSSAEMLRIDERRLLLWTGESADDPRVTAIDLRTGDVAWTTSKLADVVDEPLSRGRGVQSQMPDGLPFAPEQTLAVLGDHAILLVQRSGGVAAFDDATGSLLWSVDATLQEVHLALAHKYGLILAGLDREVSAQGGSEDLQPRVLVLDPQTGDPIRRIRPHTRSGVIWMRTDAMGSLVCASSEGIEAIDLLSGRRRWSNISFEAMKTRRGWSGTTHALIENRTNGLAAIAFEDGLMSRPLTLDVRGEWDPLSLAEVHVVDDSFVAQYRRRIIRYDIEGAVIGADVVSDERNYRWVLPFDGGLVVISRHDSRQVEVEGDSGRRTQWTYRIYIMSENCLLMKDAIELPPVTKRFRDAALVDGQLLLSTDAETLVLPMPADN